jgi:uncharacterized protein YcaQ
LDRDARDARIDALIDVVVGKYAPVPVGRLSTLVSRLRYAVPQWHRELRAGFARAKHRLAHARVNDIDWYWPAGEALRGRAIPGEVRFLGPFDPIVWDRPRFEAFWGWAYRFEAYTPVAKRKLGYYALPLLWRDHVIGWANVAVKNGRMQADVGYVNSTPPRDGAFRRELDNEIERMRLFLALGDPCSAIRRLRN